MTHRKLWSGATTLPWLAVAARVLVGGIFVLAGGTKILLPHAEVMALVQQYQIIPSSLIPLIATCLPWLELGSGSALLLGFCTTPVALLTAMQLVSFMGLMVGVMASGIVLEDCGCFGNLGLHETPGQVLIRDSILLVCLLPILLRRRDVWGLDAWGQTAVSSVAPEP